MPEQRARRLIQELFAADRRRRALVALGALASVAVAAGIILGAGLSATSAGASPPAKSSGAATVQRRDLVQTDTESGTLSYANPHTVFNRLSGTVTSLPAVGQRIKPGQTLYKVDGSPSVLMAGSVPAYRTLTAGVSNGADVQELEQNLVALGFDPSRQIVVDQTFDSATTAAVERWQAALGETQTGTVTLGQVVFLPGAQRVTAVNTALGSTGGSSSSGSSGTATGARTTPAPVRPVFVSLTTTTTSSTTTTTSSDTTTTPSKSSGGTPGKSGSGSQPTSMAALLALLKAETAELAKLRATSGAGAATGATGSTGSRSSGSSAASGSSKSSGSPASASTSGASASGSSGAASASGTAANAQAILQTTSTNLVVTVALDATKQSEAVLGAPVTVQMPDGTTVDGRITAVSPVAQTSSSSSSSSGSSSGSGSSSTPSATVPITITLRNSRHVSGLDQAAVSVNFQQQKAKNVLSVPVSALLATAGGGYAVQQASAPHSLIPVTPGLFAAGYVQISGAQISPGLQVTDSQG